MFNTYRHLEISGPSEIRQTITNKRASSEETLRLYDEFERVIRQLPLH